MNERIKINDVTVLDFNDGIYVAPNPAMWVVPGKERNELQIPFSVLCSDKDGREYTHVKEFSSRVEALTLAIQVK